MESSTAQVGARRPLEFVVLITAWAGPHARCRENRRRQAVTLDGDRRHRSVEFFNSAALKEIAAAATFSSRCAMFVVPGMGTIQGFRAVNHARESCAGVTFLRRAQAWTSRTSGMLAGSASGAKRGTVARKSPSPKRPGADGAGKETHAQRAPRDEADAELLAQRKDLRSGPRHSIEYSFWITATGCTA